MRETIWLLVIAAFMTVSVVDSRMQLPEKPPEKMAIRMPVQPRIAITVSGAVKNPGVYQLSKGSTVQDALDAAGGVLPQANMAKIDLKQKLTRKRTLAIKALKTHPNMS